MHDDIYQMYLEEVEQIEACSPQEEAALLGRLKAGDAQARERLLEGSLAYAAELARAYLQQGLSAGDLVQEANLALISAVDSYQEGDFRTWVSRWVDRSVREALESQQAESRGEEEILARVNVLKEISRQMAEELGREATVEELARKMKMTEDEIREIMKLTLDAMSVSPYEEEPDTRI